MTEKEIYLKPLTDKNAQLLTGVCCQWRCSASYDSKVHIETFVLRGKFNGKIATEQQPPTVRLSKNPVINKFRQVINN